MNGAYVKKRCIENLKSIDGKRIKAEGNFKEYNYYLLPSSYSRFGYGKVEEIVFSEIILYVNNERIHITHEGFPIHLSCGQQFKNLDLSEGDLVEFSIKINLDIEDCLVNFSRPTKVNLLIKGN